jgi:AGZA family xanthine/uracil permease-like MFS transporter
MKIQDYFQITRRGSSWSTEILGGITTFVTMAYIIVVNPAVLSFAGIPTGPSTVATILTAVVGCVAMGLYTNRPIAVAPYMGENAFIAFGLAALSITWQQRLGAVFVSGILLLIITMLGLRTWLAKALSPSMKSSFAVGIGFFLVFIGLYESGIVTSFVVGMPWKALVGPNSELLRRPDVPLKIGNLTQPAVYLSLLGFFLMALLICRRVKGGLLIGMGATAGVGFLLGHGQAPQGVAALPFTGAYDLSPIALQLDIASVLKLSFLPVFLTLFLMVFLDTLGTLVGLGAAAKILDEKGNFPQIERPMMVDAGTTMIASLLGTSTSGAFIESATGIREGARTGVAAIVTGLLFALSLFLIPLFEPLQHLQYVYAPALVIVGILMMERMTAICFEDWTEAIPAVVTIGAMVFTYNIANGLTAGLALYPLLKLACGRVKELHPGSVILGLCCLGYYVFGMIH